MSKKQHVESSMTIERGDQEIDITIEGIYIAGLPEVRYTRNGDGSPAEPAEIDDLQAFDGENEIELTNTEAEKAIEILLECEVDDGPDPDDARDYEWEREEREKEYFESQEMD